MFHMYEISLDNASGKLETAITHLESYETGEEAVLDLLDNWHEGDTKLFVIYTDDDQVWGTVAREHENTPGYCGNYATVSRTGGATQRYSSVYHQVNGKTVAKITSL